MENQVDQSTGDGTIETKALGELNLNTVNDHQGNSCTEAGKTVNWGGQDIEPADENDGPDQEDNKSVATSAAVTATKKRKKKPKSKRGLGKPTGFEEYYVDPPITPAEYEEERHIYDSSRTFSERIETAIQRYKAKRNLDSERKNLFDKYMSYGGVDSGPKMFSGGLDATALEDKNAAEIATMTATNFVSTDKDESDAQFVVDFNGCLKGFLSSRLRQCFDLYTEKNIKSHIAVIRNFLNYILHHDVCPEYKDDINAARATCDLAEKQLWCCTLAAAWMTGDFNIACSTLFGGYYEHLYVGDQDWAKGIDLDPGMSPDTARKVLKAGLAAQGTDEIIQAFKSQTSRKEARVVTTTSTGFEVLELIFADQDVLALYEKVPGRKPLGKMKVQTWYNPALPSEDLTEEEEAVGVSKPAKQYELWLEDEVLEHCFVGMKFVAVIRELSFGVTYFDTVTGIYCSFYDVLPNERMIGWREHVYLPPREKIRQGDEAEEHGNNGDVNASLED